MPPALTDGGECSPGFSSKRRCNPPPKAIKRCGWFDAGLSGCGHPHTPPGCGAGTNLYSNWECPSGGWRWESSLHILLESGKTALPIREVVSGCLVIGFNRTLLTRIISDIYCSWACSRKLGGLYSGVANRAFWPRFLHCQWDLNDYVDCLWKPFFLSIALRIEIYLQGENPS